MSLRLIGPVVLFCFVKSVVTWTSLLSKVDNDFPVTYNRPDGLSSIIIQRQNDTYCLFFKIRFGGSSYFDKKKNQHASLKLTLFANVTSDFMYAVDWTYLVLNKSGYVYCCQYMHHWYLYPDIWPWRHVTGDNVSTRMPLTLLQQYTVI